MPYLIYENGVLVNRIVSSETFCQKYCADNGYTYELEPKLNYPIGAPAEQDDLAALLVDHEYRLMLLELGLTDGGGDI